VIDMVVAFVSTKLPILLGHGFGGFADPTAHVGFWAMAHEARTDIAMLLGCAFLVIVGAGALSLDARRDAPAS
jgi:putative oxidoreductase